MEKSKYFIDSNVFFYAKIGDKKYGECSKKVIRKIYENKIESYIDSVILLEVANALSKFFQDKNIIREELLAIMSLPLTVIEITKDDIVESSKIRELKPYDALHLYIANRVGARIISADSDFDKHGRLDPCEFD